MTPSHLPMQQGTLLHMLGHDMLVECMSHLTCTADRRAHGCGEVDADADDEEDGDAKAGCAAAAASCHALLHATLGLGTARLQLELNTADIPW